MMDGMCRQSFVPLMDAEDVKQEILMKLWIVKDGFCPEKAKYGTWAYSIMRNLIKDLQRESYRDKRSIFVHCVSLDSIRELQTADEY